eukprot:11193175-Lingulodinium_polyedra.AAC.1
MRQAVEANNWHAEDERDRTTAEFWFRFFISQQELPGNKRAWAGRVVDCEHIHSDHGGTFAVG